MASAAIASPVLFCRSTSAALSSDQPTIAEWEAIWTRVLERHLDEAGRIDFAGLKGDRTDLDRVVAFIAAVDPASDPARFPSLAFRLAYDINAYNALAMKGVLDAACRRASARSDGCGSFPCVALRSAADPPRFTTSRTT